MQPETFMPLPGPQPERRGKNLVFLAHFGLGDCKVGKNNAPQAIFFFRVQAIFHNMRAFSVSRTDQIHSAGNFGEILGGGVNWKFRG